MPSYNNRLNCVIALHRKSEGGRWKTFVRSRMARALRRVGKKRS